MPGHSSCAERIAHRASRMVDKCAAIASIAGFNEPTVKRVARAAEIGAAVTTNVGGVVADRLVDRFNRLAIRVDDDDPDEGNITIEGYGSDGDPEDVRAHRPEVAKEIYQYIHMASAAYQDKSMAEEFDFVEKSRLIHHVDEPSKVLGKLASTDTEVHVCILDEGTAAFAFRGTEFHSFMANLDWRSWLQDSATDLHLLQRSVKLYDASRKPVYRSAPDMTAHKGFQLSFRDVTRTTARKDNLRMVLEDLGMKAGDVQRVVCVGHSLGGALATLCAKWCREVAFPDAEIKCVTIGSPRVGNSVFAHDFNTRVANESYRVVNKGDLVPCIPHQWSGYKHVRGAIYLARHPTNKDAIACTWGGTRCNIRTLSIMDHMLGSYLSSFEKLLKHHQHHQ